MELLGTTEARRCTSCSVFWRLQVMIHQGTATVESQGVLIAECGPGEFLGEARPGPATRVHANPAMQTKLRDRFDKNLADDALSQPANLGVNMRAKQ